jgi:hypothetical protein
MTAVDHTQIARQAVQSIDRAAADAHQLAGILDVCIEDVDRLIERCRRVRR